MSDKDANGVNTPNDFDLFISKFEIWNVGNLHVYSKPENTLEADYYFKGEKIGPEFQKYLSTDLKHFLNKSPGYIYTLGLIKGLDEKNLYLIRNPTKRSPYQITLCRLDGEQLEPVQTLAYRKKVWNGYLQLDTWIQDVDGDTMLDLIQKGKRTNRKGKIKKAKTKVYLQEDDGTFEYSRDVNIEPKDYIFE